MGLWDGRVRASICCFSPSSTQSVTYLLLLINWLLLRLLLNLLLRLLHDLPWIGPRRRGLRLTLVLGLPLLSGIAASPGTRRIILRH